MVVTGKGDFTGTIEIPFSITKRDLTDADNPVAIHAADVMFVGKPGKYMAVPVLTDRNGKKLTAGTDYEKTYVYSKADGTILTKTDIPQVGDIIQITVTGKGCYTGTAECTYRIAKASFAKAKISAKAQVYTGEEITLTADSLTVKIGNVKLVEGQDYEIVTQSYKNNVQKGTASVTIRGIGNYGGEKTVSFKIVSRQFIWFWEVL